MVYQAGREPPRPLHTKGEGRHLGMTVFLADWWNRGLLRLSH